jgi:hypothetical protein
VQPFRIQPAMPVGAYQTYSISAPTDATVRAACEQVDCAQWRNGWRTLIDEGTDLGRQQAVYIRTGARRTFRERPGPGGLTEFIFDSGQRCFADHRTRPETYRVRAGDWRGNPSGQQRTHTRPIDWVEDFQENQGRVSDQIERG